MFAMRKTSVLSMLVVVVLLAVAVIAEAQPQAKIRKIGELLFRPGPTLGAGREVFRQSLRELGYVEGKSITYETRSAEGKLDRFPVLADELVRLKVDVLVASSTAEALVFKNATRTIPIVFVVSSDPVSDRLVDSLARPGGNLTGVTTIASRLAGKRLELIKETVPNLHRVAVLWNPRDPGSNQQWKESQLAGRELGLQLHSMEVSSADKYEIAFKETAKAGSGALAQMAGSVASANRKTDRGPGGKTSAAGDLRAGRLCRERWHDVLRTRPSLIRTKLFSNIEPSRV
jgi:ABC-type uncharacterized transport system substrate-binding protein